ncbi:unnamed protein product [Nippostrongylus brasiliensis]|uniref:DDE_3 domain-containing protein n=1 Tax=Nippostrongylus brasiliensis TaxID=27835 RepID=A0A0N4XZ33_NIPBR|nr:unnamed protein product [Nippostrongylus brasiliensis]
MHGAGCTRGSSEKRKTDFSGSYKGSRSYKEQNSTGFTTGYWTKGVWPSNSPDLNPMDFAVWSILKNEACRTRHTSIEDLKQSLLKAWEEISMNTLATILDNFVKRLKACKEGKGGHFLMKS